MSRRYVVLAATWLCAACPSPSAPSRPAPADDTPLRIRVAQAEARRAGGVAELAELAAHGAKQDRMLALRGLGRIGATGAVSATGAAGAAGAAGAFSATGEIAPTAAATGAPPIAILIAALGDADPDIVGAAAGALGVAASLDDGDLGATAPLIAALPRGGGLVVEALGRAATAAAQPALVTALSDPRLAELAALALARHGRRKLALTDPARRALVAATASPDPAVRYAAVYALAREHQPPDDLAVVTALIQRLTDPVGEVRAQAIAGLGRRKAIAAGRAAGARLDGLLLDRDWRVAVEAVRALGDSDDSKDAIAAALARRYDELASGDPTAAHVLLEGEKLLAGAAARPLVAAVLTRLATGGSAAAAIPALTRGWIQCLAISAMLRGRPDADLAAVAQCPLADPLRLPLVAELISADTGSLAGRRTALGTLLRHGDPRVRAAGLGALAALWKSGDATDHETAIATVVAALASRDMVVAGAAVDAAAALYEAIGAGDHALLDAAVIARATTERDPELGATVLALIGTRALTAGAGACRAALSGDAVRARAAVTCLQALGTPAAAPAPGAVRPPPADVSTVIGKVVRWRVLTSRGELVIALHPEVAPWTVATIVQLTRKGFYDGLEFHRVVPNFVVQGGDPTGSGSGGPGFTIPAEPGTLGDGAGYRAGGVGVADAGRDSGGSQWFVMHSRAPHLDGRYTWFGTLEHGQKSADALLIGDRIVRATVELSP
jgi:cyclophilin family peptidyl-prolyl cis-trans isomerase